MKKTLASLTVLMLSCSLLAAAQEADLGDSCSFTVQPSNIEPLLAGPDEVLSILHVIQQPDSPIQITSVNCEGTSLWMSNGAYSWEPQCEVGVRNKSDSQVKNFETVVFLVDDGGSMGFSMELARYHTVGLAPNQEFKLAGKTGRGHGGARNNRVRMVVGVDWVQMDACRYYPSMRLPAKVGLALPWR